VPAFQSCTADRLDFQIEVIFEELSCPHVAQALAEAQAK